MSWSKWSGWSWLALAAAACSSPVPIGDVRNDASSMNMDGSGGTAGSGGAGGGGGTAGSSGNGGTAGSGGAGGMPTIDATTDITTTGGSGGAAGTSMADGSAGASGAGGDAGAGGTSMSDGAAGTGGATGGPDAGEGGPGTQPSCARLLAMVNRNSWIAFDSDRDSLNRNLYMMHPDRSGFTQLTKGTNIDREPSFSYDGTRLSYTSVVAEKSQIFIMDLATRASVQLTKRPEGADQSTFSRDGQWVAFHSGRSIHIIKTDGTGERLVTTPADYLAAYQWPSFNVDGSEILFDRDNDILSIKVDGTGLRNVVNNGNWPMKMPTASPSGVDVAYTLGCGSEPAAIWISPFATATDPCKGRRISPLDSYFFDAWRPTWGTGSVLAYHRSSQSTNLAVIAMTSSMDPQACFLTSGPEDSRNPSWSP